MTSHDIPFILLGMALGYILGEIMDWYYTRKPGLDTRKGE